MLTARQGGGELLGDFPKRHERGEFWAFPLVRERIGRDAISADASAGDLGFEISERLADAAVVLAVIRFRFNEILRIVQEQYVDIGQMEAFERSGDLVF